MTWGEVESEPVKLGPHSLRVAVGLRDQFEENPREKLAHQLANAYLEKGRFKTQKKEAQIQKMLTPYARRFAEGPSSGLMSSISSRSGLLRPPDSPRPELDPQVDFEHAEGEREVALWLDARVQHHCDN